MTRMLDQWAAFEAGVVHRDYLPAPTEGGRMSSEHRPYLTSDDLAMLERVLAQSNFPCVSSEACLRETLSDVSALNDYPDEAIGYDTAISIAAADMATILPGVQYGYGKRVEADKSWTIHHVFTGVPVSLGARDLINLDAKTAVRALRLLNTSAVNEPEAQ